jgi:hypothetical protein
MGEPGRTATTSDAVPVGPDVPGPLPVVLDGEGGAWAPTVAGLVRRPHVLGPPG